MLWANAHLALLLERAFGVPLRPASAELACSVVGDASGVIADVFGTHVTFGTAEWRLLVAHKICAQRCKKTSAIQSPTSRHSLGNQHICTLSFPLRTECASRHGVSGRDQRIRLGSIPNQRIAARVKALCSEYPSM
jgi:hypothetical protein